jgi:hypothetical protein
MDWIVSTALAIILLPFAVVALTILLSPTNRLDP